jgi:small-conductance mechanosensitive channel
MMSINILNFILYSTSKGPVTIENLLEFIFILSFSIIISKIIILYLRRYFKNKVSKDVGETTIKFLYYGSLLIVFITILPLIGLDPSGLLLAGGITGIVLGFASQNIVGNLISGVFLMMEKPIKIGDQVEINKISGYVTDIRIISTFIRTFDGLLIRIPNQQVFTTNITNTVSYPVRRFDFTIKIRYSDDADAAIWFVQNLIDKEPFALSSPPPYVYVNELGENSVNLVVRIWAPTSEWYVLKTRFLWAIKKVLEENNIEIPFPQREIYLHNVPEKKPIPEKQSLNQGEQI